MSTHSLPLLPPGTDSNLLGQLLVSHSTSDGLVWALMSRVDLSSQIDGKPLLQVFCENHKGYAVHRMPLADGARLPAVPGEPWPDPRFRPGPSGLPEKNKWPSPAMWLAAALIFHSHDPFAWKTEDGYDIVDFVVSWRNDHLFNQLMRLPGAPSPAELDRRPMLGDAGRSYLHSLTSQDHGGPYMLDALLAYGLDPNIRDSKGRTPLHVSRASGYVASLLDAGADPWGMDKSGKTALDTWSATFLAPASAASRSYVFVPMLKAWLEHVLPQDRHRAAQVVAPAAGMALKRDRRALAKEIATAAGFPLTSATHVRGDKRVGILPFLLSECARRRKPVALANLIEVLDVATRTDLDRPDIRGISLFAWAWAAASDGIVDRQEVMVHDRLRKILCDSGLEQEASRLYLLEQALLLVDQKPFKGKELDEIITAALNNQVQRMVKEAHTGVHDGDLAVVAKHPRLLGLIFNNKVQDNLIKQVLDVFPLVVANADEKVKPRMLLALCQAAKLNAVSSPHAAAGVTGAFVSAFDDLHQLGVRWDHRLPGAEDALSCLRSAATQQGELARLAGKLEEASLELHTAPVHSPGGRGPRL